MSSASASVLRVVLEQSARVLETYRIDPGLIQEHANNERRIKEGGYGDRQIYELVQNGADELRNDERGEIAVVLTGTHLYCANQGAAMTPEGADTILRMGVSRKRGGQIGRFGVGVKSVLSVTDMPEFFSREDDKSFGFDREWAAEQIRAVQPSAVEMPVLRMARPLDRDRCAQADPVLAELLTWATTVVRLPLKPSALGRLAEDIANFPAEFSLFSPHVGTITLEDRRTKRIVRRQIFLKVDGDRRALQREAVMADGSAAGATERWRVFTRTHMPSAHALGEAGELHDRPEIDVSWAVPDRVGRDNKLGEFWAFFPTNYTMTLRGILNAPWKTSEDRQNLYGRNAFNEELIKVAAELVVDSLPLLADDEDVCAYLDHVPARGREEPQWAAKDLVAEIWASAARKPSLPDQRGRFGTARQVQLHPEKLRPEWLALWAGYPGRPDGWCHHSVERTPHRRQSAERILTAAKVEPASIGEWLEAMVRDATPEASAQAIKIAADMKRHQHPLAEEAAKARIILTESLGLVAPSNRVFRRTASDGLADNTVYVDVRVHAEDDVARDLETLGVHEADYSGRFVSVVEQGFHGYGERQWRSLWELSRLAGPAAVIAALREQRIDAGSTLKVRTVSGEFRRLRECLLPGKVVPGDGSRDGKIAVDMDFHRDDRQILRDIGVREGPAARVDPRNEPWFAEYTQTLWDSYWKRVPASERTIQYNPGRFDGTNPAGPLQVLIELSQEGRSAFLQELPSEGLVPQWTIQVGRQSTARKPVMSPLQWVARKYGHLRTSRGLRPVLRAVGPQLRVYRDLLPVADVSPSLASTLHLPNTLGELKPAHWTRLAAEAAASTEDDFPGRVYALIFEADVPWPDGAVTRCRVGDEWRSDIPDAEIAVTASRVEYQALIREQVPALLAPSEEAAVQMRASWHMLSPGDVIQKELRSVPQTDPVLLVEEFPHLKLKHRAKVDGWSLVRCSELEEVIRTPNGMRTQPIHAAAQLQDHTVFVLRPSGDMEVLLAVDGVLKLGMGSGGCQSILNLREQQRKNERVRRAREAKDAADKLLVLAGAEALKKGLPEGLLESEEAETGKPVDDRRIAVLAHNAHGTDALRVYRRDIEENIPEAAVSFRGDTNSLRLVNELGFSESYAGNKSETLPPIEVVAGPTEFPRLHDYQEKLAGKMFDLLTRYKSPRAMLCLPTGAGKTRVAAEAVIRVIREHGLGGRPVLWIAQSKELCEQAVQSWSFVWSKVGPPERLTINRLWESREATAIRETSHLVVATDAKLSHCLHKDEYAWLRDAAMVMVDEAHVSISPEYTRLLGLLGLTHRETTRPLIGLTATPFRNFNEAETHRLVERFGGLRLDEGVFDGDPYVELQELGVLSRVEHRELTGSTFQLTPDELGKTQEFFGGGWLPSSAEERLGLDGDRNRMLIQEIENLPEDSRILLFATSVNHAKLMAAKLKDRGISAAPIESATPDADRRNRIEKFRKGDIRVLTNYGVLAQGFDAPATSVVVVARPVFSPNSYQQMIGRGLRGPRNGGKETCLILDVADNIENFDRRLAFTGFDRLWKRA
ncbi:DEAD/DEAH box helicase [Nonomuraea sp. NPDC001684]